MKNRLIVLGLLSLLLSLPTVAMANGLLIPSEPDLPALAMLNHHVNVTLEDQIAITSVEQTFRNHTDRELEATYVFPIPEGANVNEFSLWVDGKKVSGELVTADDAKSMYTKIVRQTKNPALLDHMGSGMLRLKIFPIKPNADQKISLRFTSIATKEHDLVEYTYPIKSDRAAASTMEEFRVKVELKSKQALSNIYSPTHEISVVQDNDSTATISFEQSQANLDRDFKLFYTETGKDIGLNALDYRPISSEEGYMMFLVSPRAELASDQRVPRDIVFVMDTSGSMRNDDKLKQAQQALCQCLDGLAEDDRFAVICFGSTVNRYRDQLVSASAEHVENGKKWINGRNASGGTAIHAAMMSALSMRGESDDRMYTVAFFTDGQPTIGQTNTDEILKDMQRKNSASTRIFSFGLGNDLNAAFLDQIAEQTRAISSYVRPRQAIKDKVASFFKKIHHPVLANLSLETSDGVQLAEVYPPQLPDLFHGDQLVVLARYNGEGSEKVVLNGQVGPQKMKFEYEVDFTAKSVERPFVEELWARRKVGYLLDQIRLNGEKKELVDEVVLLAKRYGITTPYTSYLIMPDAPLRLAAKGQGSGRGGRGGGGGFGARLNRFSAPSALEGKNNKQRKLTEFAQQQAGQLARSRNSFQDRALDPFESDESSLAPGTDTSGSHSKQGSSALAGQREALAKAKRAKKTWDKALYNYRNGKADDNRVMSQGIDLSTCTNKLKCETQIQATAIRNVASRNCMELGGVWIDEKFTSQTETVTIRAQSDAYFRILELHPQMKDVFQLGNHIVWIAPNGSALVIDTTDGDEKLSDDDISRLFASK